MGGSGVCCDGLSAASRHFVLRSSCTLWTPRRMTSAFDTLSSSIHSSSFSAVALSRRTLREMSFGLSVGRPIFLFPNTITSLFGVANNITYRRRKVKRILLFCRGRRPRRPVYRKPGSSRKRADLCVRPDGPSPDSPPCPGIDPVRGPGPTKKNPLRQESGPPPGRPAFCVRQFYRSVPSRISRTRSTPPSTENRTSSPAKPKP